MTDARFMEHTPRDLNFHKTLDRAMGSRTETDYLMRSSEPHWLLNQDVPYFIPDNGRNDEDYYHLESLDIDAEMMHLVENNIQYRRITEMLLQKMTTLNHAIGDGGK